MDGGSLRLNCLALLQQLVDEFVLKHYFEMFPVIEDGHLGSWITLNQVKEILNLFVSNHFYRFNISSL